METCNFTNFIEKLKPWLSKNYIHKVKVDAKNVLMLYFTDGVNEFYRIDDCNEAQINSIIQDLDAKGIQIES